MPVKTTPPFVRMLNRKAVDDDGCWIWPGATNRVPDRFGGGNYGQIRIDGKTHMVHRVSYEYYVGPLVDGMVIDHRCHNEASDCAGNGCKHRRCWNPEHLRLISFTENCAEGFSPGAVTARTGFCKRGHEQIDANVSLWRRPSGTVRRQCRICQNLSAARRSAVKHGTRSSI